MESNKKDRLLTPEQVSERTGIAPQTLANWRTKDQADVESGGPPWVKTSGRLGTPGGRVRYPEQALNVWFAERQTPKVPKVHRDTLRPTA